MGRLEVSLRIISTHAMEVFQVVWLMIRNPLGCLRPFVFLALTMQINKCHDTDVGVYSLPAGEGRLIAGFQWPGIRIPCLHIIPLIKCNGFAIAS